MSKIKELSHFGQSIWFDYIQKQFLADGGLKALINDGVRGVTSNPSIFEKAIAGSADYDDTIRSLADSNLGVKEIYEALVLKDIRTASDQMSTVYKTTQGSDGFVSLEVSPKLAFDTEGTIQEAKRLFEAADRKNLMIKVPATDAGIPAIQELIRSGISINATLLFGVHMYERVAEAYISGLEGLAEAGPTVAGGLNVTSVRSVASFFVSRVDAAVDAELEQAGRGELAGKTAIANAKLAYSRYLSIFAGERWNRLAEQGAEAQRLLWASTGTKNPEYPDTLYVDGLIGKNTVNTVPPSTLEAFRDHGKVSESLAQGIEEAVDEIENLKTVGLDLDGITTKLLDEGVTAFENAYDSLLGSIETKRAHLSTVK